jgi:hypothetical protein
MKHRMRVHWGAAIAAVYIIFATATVSFVVFAVGKPVELVSADYYEQSLKHDTHMQALANADALGRAVRVEATEDSPAIDIVIPAVHGGGEANANGAANEAVAGAMAGVTGTVTLYRPSDRTADRVTPLSLDAQGHQRVSVDGAARGRWVVKLAWRAAGQEFYREQAVLLP